MNIKPLILVILIVILLTIMFDRWETVTEIGEGPYLVKRDKLTSVTREYLPGKYVYQTVQDRFMVTGATFLLLALMGITANELFKEMGWSRTPAKEPEVDIITGSRWYGWGKVIALVITVALIILFINILKVIPKLL
ncbi:MAG: hypothetical protein ACQES4_13075 [Bacillota bacterium]